MIIFIAAVVVPIALHVISPQAMPWWPDTVSLGIAFGVTAGLIAARFRNDREINRRLFREFREFVRRSRG